MGEYPNWRNILPDNPKSEEIFRDKIKVSNFDYRGQSLQRNTVAYYLCETIITTVSNINCHDALQVFLEVATHADIGILGQIKSGVDNHNYYSIEQANIENNPAHWDTVKKLNCGQRVLALIKGLRATPLESANTVFLKHAKRLSHMESRFQEFGSKPSAKNCIVERKMESTVVVPAMKKTEYEAWMMARLGQGVFRNGVLSAWNGACALSGMKEKSFLIASHMKPWSVSDETERIDPDNGIPLLPNFDCLFDGGWITFQDDGHIVIGPYVEDATIRKLGLSRSARLLKPLNDRQKSYLRYHRENVYPKRMM